MTCDSTFLEGRIPSLSWFVPGKEFALHMQQDLTTTPFPRPRRPYGHPPEQRTRYLGKQRLALLGMNRLEQVGSSITSPAGGHS